MESYTPDSTVAWPSLVGQYLCSICIRRRSKVCNLGLIVAFNSNLWGLISSLGKPNSPQSSSWLVGSDLSLESS